MYLNTEDVNGLGLTAIQKTSVQGEKGKAMSEQITFLGKEFFSEAEIAEMEKQAETLAEYAKRKRRWENAFQRWSDEQALDGAMSYGCCGYGSMCEWCKDNDYGRPCVRALNAMCREKGTIIDYDNMDFESIWGNYG